MRVAYIAAGAAGMYCGSCINDNTLATALRLKGVDLVLIPTYTPLRTDGPDASIDRVFYGGINVYLQQKLAFFRRAPEFVDRLMNVRTLLNSLSWFSGSTRAEELGALTVSMLKGEQGSQRKELKKLVRWLKDDLRPDLVHLTNSMFLGMVREMKRELGIPVLCSVQGEDVFLDGLAEPYRNEALSLARDRARDVDAFVATCDWYASSMAAYLQAPRERFRVVPLGISLEGHGRRERDLPETPFTIGYMARVAPEKGLHLLADAVGRLAEQVGTENIRLLAAGYLGGREKPYFRQVVSLIESRGLSNAFEYRGEVDRQQKIDFLNSVHVLSVPTPYREPKGLFVLEALANGTPVVQPRHGAFPALLDRTGGGILVDPDSPEALAEGLSRMMSDREAREAMGRRGRAAVHRMAGDACMADAMLGVYRHFVAG
ncbi:MAG: glycosyltransferase family 4 protein [Candidatus Latescibacteria bacterium]|nr:glycosyltransferase family 4 protein [Candidatus Latescibacterota bacterium]